MIKLERGKKPSYLTEDKVKELTLKFKSNKKLAVWKNEDIGSALLTSSSFKCAYCECLLQTEDSYMQVEHFKDKDKYPDDVVNWENLLPSCSRCNRKKWTHDVVANPIVNPYIDDPKSHLCQEAFRLYGKDEKGNLTISKLFLNDDERIVYPRFRVANEVGKQLTKILEHFSNLEKVNESLTGLLLSCQPDRPFSAFAASSLHANRDYKLIKEELERNDLWDSDLDELHIKSLSLVLDMR